MWILKQRSQNKPIFLLNEAISTNELQGTFKFTFQFLEILLGNLNSQEREHILPFLCPPWFSFFLHIPKIHAGLDRNNLVIGQQA